MIKYEKARRLLRDVAKYPGMYLPSAGIRPETAYSFDELSAFIVGYTCALPPEENFYPAFVEWMDNKMGKSNLVFWARVRSAAGVYYDQHPGWSGRYSDILFDWLEEFFEDAQ